MLNHTDITVIFAAVITVLLGGLISFGVWNVKKLNLHDLALTRLIEQVNPPGDKSLRELLHEIELKQVRLIEQVNTRKDGG